jgi:hypothetical protein
MTEPTPILETKAAFARRLGVGRAYVGELGRNGRLVMVGKLVDVRASEARIEATRDPAREDLRQAHAERRRAAATGGKPAAAPASAPPGSGADDLETVAPAEGEGRKRYKALTMQYENQTIKLEMALRMGKRYARAGWVASVAAIGGVTRAGGERLIDQGAPTLALLRNDDERLAELRRLVARLRNSVKREFPRALRRQRLAARGAGG